MDHRTDIIISLIARIREKANRFISEELKTRGLEKMAPIHGDVLYALFVHNKLTMKEVAEVVDRKKSTVTTIIDKLINLGYVKKQQLASDSRTFEVSLTAQGKLLKQPLIEISTRLSDKVYKNMPVRERQQLVASLKKINDNW